MKKAMMPRHRPILKQTKPKTKSKPISPSAELYLQRYLKALYLAGESNQ